MAQRSAIFIASGVLLAALAISGCISGPGGSSSGNTVACNGTDRLVQPGDNVTVEFTSRHTTGKVIESGKITFISMTGQMRTGFDEAVEGMCLGAEKHVSVPPEKAYGLWDPSLVAAIPTETEINRTFSVNVSEFMERYGKNPVVGLLYLGEKDYLPLRVGSVSKDTVMIERVAEAGTTIAAGKVEPWALDVTGVTAEKISLFRNVTDGEVVQTGRGKRTASVANGTITLDMNVPFAGETILYDIKVAALVKTA